jgi:general secretion pathway protein D
VTIDQNTQYMILTRKTESYVTAKSGDIIVLGGFRQNTNSKSRSRLGGIPIIGDILGPRSREKRYNELIFFLRPYVLTNNSDVDNRDTMRRIEQLPTRDEIKSFINPQYVPPKKSVLEKILPE